MAVLELIAFYRYHQYNPLPVRYFPMEKTAVTTTFLDVMPQKNTGKGRPSGRPKGQSKKPQYPSRENTKYAGIPRSYWESLEKLIEEDERYEGRSVAFLVTRAVRQFLDAHGRLPPKQEVGGGD